MDFTNIPIKQIIPQRPPFLMVDRVLQCDMVDALTEFLVQSDNILLDDKELSGPGIIENMAQSCAARMGCVDIMQNEPIKIGYIGGVRDVTIIRNPQCGETLNTHVHVVEEMLNVLLADVSVQIGKEIIASGSVKVAKTDIIAELTEIDP